eukprot:gene13230-9076_t
MITFGLMFSLFFRGMARKMKKREGGGKRMESVCGGGAAVHSRRAGRTPPVPGAAEPKGLATFGHGLKVLFYFHVRFDYCDDAALLNPANAYMVALETSSEHKHEYKSQGSIRCSKRCCSGKNLMKTIYPHSGLAKLQTKYIYIYIYIYMVHCRYGSSLAKGNIIPINQTNGELSIIIDNTEVQWRRTVTVEGESVDRIILCLWTPTGHPTSLTSLHMKATQPFERIKL